MQLDNYSHFKNSLATQDDYKQFDVGLIRVRYTARITFGSSWTPGLS